MHRRLLGAALTFASLGAGLAGAPPLAAQGWQLTITPSVGRGSVGALFDRAYAFDTIFAGERWQGRLEQRLTFERMQARGLRLEATSPAGWTAFLDGSRGRTRFEYHRLEQNGRNELSDAYELFRFDDAWVTTLTVGGGRALRGSGWRPEVVASGGATLQHLSLERKPGVFCAPGFPCADPDETEPWEGSYTAPGASLGLALRWHVARGLGVEVRSAATLARVRTGAIDESVDPFLRRDGARDADWVRSTHVVAGVFSRVGVAPPPVGVPGASRLSFTPYVSAVRPGRLLDREGEYEGTTTVSAPTGLDTIPMTTTTTRRLTLEPAPALGLRLDVRVRAAWSIFADGSFARTRYQHLDSLTRAPEGRPAQGFRNYGHDRDRASVLALGLGIARDLPLGAGPFGASVGLGGFVQHVQLDRIDVDCRPIDPTCRPYSDPWEESYTTPGLAGTAALRWTVAPGVALEARTRLALGRVRNGDIAPSLYENVEAYPADPDVPKAQWMRRTELALGVSLSR